MSFRMIAAGAIALLLTACSSAPTRIAFEPGTRQALTEVKVLSILSQDEIVVRADPVGVAPALGGGLIGAIIDSKIGEIRQNTLQETLAPFYAAIDDYDFRTHFERTLESTLAGNPLVKFSPLERRTLPLLLKDSTARIATLQAKSGQMLVHTIYAFTVDFTRLNVITYAEIKVPGSEAPVFMNTYFYQSRPIGAGGSDSIKHWSNSKGKEYRTTLDEAAQEMSRMLQADLAAGATDSPGSASASMEKIDGVLKQIISGPVLASSTSRKIIRHSTGEIYSLPL